MNELLKIYTADKIFKNLKIQINIDSFSLIKVCENLIILGFFLLNCPYKFIKMIFLRSIQVFYRINFRRRIYFIIIFSIEKYKFN